MKVEPFSEHMYFGTRPSAEPLHHSVVATKLFEEVIEYLSALTPLSPEIGIKMRINMRIKTRARTLC